MLFQRLSFPSSIGPTKESWPKWAYLGQLHTFPIFLMRSISTKQDLLIPEVGFAGYRQKPWLLPPVVSCHSDKVLVITVNRIEVCWKNLKNTLIHILQSNKINCLANRHERKENTKGTELIWVEAVLIFTSSLREYLPWMKTRWQLCCTYAPYV